MNSAIVTIVSTVVATVMIAARAAIAKIVRSVSVVTWATWSCIALKWAAMTALKCHIVGAIANEGDISSRYIGNIKLFASHSTIELPKGMPGEVLQHFTRTAS